MATIKCYQMPITKEKVTVQAATTGNELSLKLVINPHH